MSFHDSWRARPDLAKRYWALKQRLAVQYRHDREAYTEAKRAFIVEVLASLSVSLDHLSCAMLHG